MSLGRVSKLLTESVYIVYVYIYIYIYIYIFQFQNYYVAAFQEEENLEL